MTASRRAFLRQTAFVGSGALLAGCAGWGESPEEQLRSAAESFDELRDVRAALDNGYRSAADYVRSDDGGLGEVFVDQRQDVDLEPDALDPDRPQLLYYDLTEDGGYEPAGVGWAVGTDVTSGPPTLFGTEFGEATDGRFPGESEHYGLNAWVFDEHPEDVFEPFHPDLTGPSYVDDLDAVRGATERYLESNVAEEAGYENTEQHVYGDGGLYGVPFVESADGGLDLQRPPILLYRMTDQWYYELLGVEWFVPADEEPDALLGQSFHEPMAGHSPKFDQPEHRGLHAWVFRANPAGMFELFNPELG